MIDIGGIDDSRNRIKASEERLKSLTQAQTESVNNNAFNIGFYLYIIIEDETGGIM